jgi:hypothetical protein
MTEREEIEAFLKKLNAESGLLGAILLWAERDYGVASRPVTERCLEIIRGEKPEARVDEIAVILRPLANAARATRKGR